VAQRPEHAPGEAAPIAGTYEQLNVFGRPTGVRINVTHCHPLPAAPVGHNWALTEAASEC
jgi:azurin